MSLRKKTNSLKIIGIIFVLLSLFFGFRIYKNINRRPFPNPRETNVSLIQSWMTIDYVSKTYGIPMPEIKKNLNYSFNSSNMSIDKISKDNNISDQKVIDELKKIITDFQNLHPKIPLK